MKAPSAQGFTTEGDNWRLSGVLHISVILSTILVNLGYTE
jgi:hypothetical protein